MGRLVVDYRSGQAKWYRLARPAFRCPVCRAAVIPGMRRAGDALQAAIMVPVVGYALFLLAFPEASLTQMALASLGLVVVVALLAAACARGGYDYRRPAGSRD